MMAPRSSPDAYSLSRNDPGVHAHADTTRIGLVLVVASFAAIVAICVLFC